MNSTQYETGEQLFDRIFSNSCANISNAENVTEINPLKLDSKIFSEEFKFGDVYEISGETGSAKSELLIHLIASFILPGKWHVDVKVENEIKTILVDLSKWSFFPELLNTQLKMKIILIQNDFKFCILKLFSILEYRIRYSIKAKQQLGDPLVSKISRSSLEYFIKSCLKNLLVYECNSSEQFLLTIASCEYCIKQEQQANIQNNVQFFMPILIDSINSSFEFIDPLLLNGENHTEKFTVSLINHLLTKYKKNVFIIATKTEYALNSYSKWQNLVTKQIKLTKNSNEEFQMINSKGEKYLFKIGNFGVSFKEQ